MLTKRQLSDGSGNGTFQWNGYIGDIIIYKMSITPILIYAN